MWSGSTGVGGGDFGVPSWVGTGRGGGMGKGNDQQPMDSAQALTVVIGATLFAFPIRFAISSISSNSDSIALGVPARSFVWRIRVVGETRGCHSCLAFRCLGYVLVSA